jgi:hypothetical protein
VENNPNTPAIETARNFNRHLYPVFLINCLFNIKYICDYEKACLSLDFVEKQFILKLPV